MHELCRKSATELAGLIRTGDVSSREVVEAHLGRIDEVNDYVNAVTLTLSESALAAADAADAAGGEASDEGAGAPEIATEPAPTRKAEQPRLRYRVRFAKRGDLRWLSHLDLMRTVQRAFKFANI